jgi:DNA polymerase-1
MLESLAVLDEKLCRADARLVNMVHDELVVEARAEQAEHVRHLVVEAMCEGFVRMFDADYMLEDLVESSIGKTWADAKQ